MSPNDFDELVTTVGAILTVTCVLTVLLFGLFFGIAQYEAGVLNTLF